MLRYKAEKRQPGAPKAEVVVLGGALSTDEVRPIVYDGILDKNSRLSRSKRFIANPASQIRNMPEMLKRVEGRIEDIVSVLDERVAVVGHSIGGIQANQLAMDRPDLIAGIVELGGAQNGIKQETFGTLLVRYLVDNPPDAELLNSKGAFMNNRRQRLKNHWPSNVARASIAATYDICFPGFHDLGMPAPADQEHLNLISAPWWMPDWQLLLTNWVSRASLPANVQRLNTLLPTEHIFLPRERAVLRFIDHFREDVVAYGLKVGVKPAVLPEAQQLGQVALAAA